MNCPRCYGEGTILVCIDDICHGLGYCMHGDGEIICSTCKGEGDIDCDEYDDEVSA